MYTEMLEYIREGSKSHTSINSREARDKISNRIKLSQGEWEGAFLYMQNMGKGLPKVFKAVVNEIFQALPFFGESGS